MLMQQANKIGKNFGFPNFKCSRSWLNMFKKKNSTVIGNINGESSSLNLNTTRNWLDINWPLISAGYSIKDIFNAYKTSYPSNVYLIKP